MEATDAVQFSFGPEGINCIGITVGDMVSFFKKNTIIRGRGLLRVLVMQPLPLDMQACWFSYIVDILWTPFIKLEVHLQYTIHVVK